MSQIRNSSSNLAAFGLAAAVLGLSVSSSGQQRRIERPEGYLVIEGDAGLSTGKGSYSVVPAPRRAPSESGDTSEPGDRDQAVLWRDDSQSDEQSPPPILAPTPREACQPAAQRFSARLAVLRGNASDGGVQPLDYAVQRAMFGRTALHAPGSEADQPGQQPVPELTWDDDLKNLYRAYQSCLKAAARRAR